MSLDLTGGPTSRLRRLWRRLVGNRNARGVDLVYHESYGRAIPLASYDAERAARILVFLSDEGLVDLSTLRRPEPVSLRSLRAVHSDAYLESLQQNEAWLPIVGAPIPARQQAELLELHVTMCGGTILAARLARRRRSIAVNLGGGFHHARAAQGHGFCVFNDVALAIADLRREGFSRPILVVDLDLHDGEGTREIFARDESVHTLSIHNHDLDVAADAVASTRLALGDGVGDRVYLEAIEATLPPLMESVRPGLVFYLAGCDPARDDALGNWQVSAQGLLDRDRRVLELTRGGRRKLPLVLVLAGGYGRHAWRYTARFLSWRLGGGRGVEPPATFDLTLGRFRRIAAGLRATELTREPSDDWMLDDDDLDALGATAKPSRFLGYYTRHGLELLLEQFGFMERLRQRGFTRLRLELDLTSGTGHTARVLSGDLPEPLLEIRLRRDARSIEGMALLSVEWLQLQDPRTAFDSGRPPLPGQRHPGLGLLREVVAILVVGCERTGIDGIVFNPSRYHLARSPRRFARFIDPVVEARYRALSATLRGMPLPQASQAVEDGRVVDAATGEPLVWTPAPMVIPVSERLKRWVSRDAYERRVAASTPSAGYRLVDPR